MTRIALVALLLSWSGTTLAQVGVERLLHPDATPADWLSYSRDYGNQRHSPLRQIDARNVDQLSLAWVWQARSLEKFEATPLVVDGVLYTVQAPNDVVALDAATGRIFWTYSHEPAPRAHVLRPREPRSRDRRRHAVHGHRRRAPARDRREERHAAVGHRGRGRGGAVLDHDAARWS